MKKNYLLIILLFLSSLCSYGQCSPDITDPVITVCSLTPANLSADSNCQAIVPDLTAITATDNCSVSLTITQLPAAGSIIGLGITVVTITAIDEAGNDTTCSVNVTVMDDTSPTISCPANLTPTVGVGTCTASVVTTNPTTADNCSVTKLTWALTGATTGASPATGINNLGTQVFNLGSTTVTYTVEDAAGNFASCSYTVVVTDNSNPTISCPANLTPTVGVGTCTASVVTTNPTTADNCSVTKLTWALTGATTGASPTTGINNLGTQVFNLGSTTVTYTVEDAAGNFASCSYTVVVTDNSNPTISCPANLTPTVGVGTCTASVVTTNPTTADNCSVTKLTWALTGATTGASPTTGINNLGTQVFNLGSTTVTYTVADAANNSATCSYTVTVTDNSNPTISCPANLTPTVGVGTCTASVVTTNPTTADNCSVTKLTWALTGATTGISPTTGINNLGTQLFNLGTTTVTYTVADAANNSATCSYTVTVTDNINPTISCPANITQNVGAGTCTASVATPNPTTADNCSVTKLTWVLTGATTGASPITGINNLLTKAFNIGTTTVTYTVSDAANNSATCTYTVSVSDTINPTITCSANLTPSVGAGTCTASVATNNPVTADNCSVTKLTWALTGATIANSAVTGINNLGTSIFNLGTTTVTYTVSDAANNSATCSYTVTVSDNINPTITAPSATTGTTNVGCTSTNVVLGTPTTADNCAVASIINNAPAAFPLGSTTVIWTVTDSAGRTNTANQIVTVTDNINPTISCPANITQNVGAGTCTASVVTPNPTTADNCSVTKLTWVLTGATTGASPTTGINNLLTKAFNIGTTTVTYTVSDAANNSATCSYTVSVSDTINPTITCSANLTPSVGAGTCTASVATNNPVTADNCSVTKLTWALTGATTGASPVTGINNLGTRLFNLGVTTVSYRVEDGMGNFTTCSYTVTVSDNINPTITAPSAKTGTTNVGCTSTNVILGTPTTADNCAVASITNNAPAAFPLGSTTVIWTVTDSAGRTNTANQTVTVTDNINPTISCPANITQNVGAGTCAATVATPNPTTADNCSVTKLTWALTGATTGTSGPTGINYLPTRVFNIGTTTVTYTVTDAANNSATCSYTVIVSDNISPTITCPFNITQNVAAGTCTANVATPVPARADNCAVTKLTWALTGATTGASLATGINNLGTRLFNLGVTTVAYRVEDAMGNFTTCSYTVTVLDNIAPVATVVNVTAQCSVTLTAPTATDNCAGTVTGTTADPLFYDIQGTHVVTWSFNDGNGNVITRTQNVIIDDTAPPVANISPLPTVSASGCEVASITAPTAYDTCKGTITGTTTTQFPITTQGSSTVTWTYNDGNGNTSTQIQNVTLTAPAISGGSLVGSVTGLTPPAVPSDNIAINSCPDDINPVTMNLSGQVGTIIRWEKFEAGDTAWSVINNDTNTYSLVFNFDNTKSTLFRVVIQVGNCTTYSNMVNVHAIPPDVPPILDQSDFNICLNDSVSLVARSGYSSTINVGDGGDFDNGQFPDKWDPTQWMIDDQVAGAQWTAAGNNTKFNNWSGTNDHPVGTLYNIKYDSDDFKFGIAHGNYNSAGYIAEFGVGPTTLETPLFSLVGLETAAVEFDQAYNLHAGDTAKLELLLFAADGTTLENTILLQNLIGTSPQANSWAPVPYPYKTSPTTIFLFNNDNSSFDISDYIGNSNVRVKWTFFGTTDESTWAIDNISVPVQPYFDDVEWTDGIGEPGEYIIRNKLEAVYTFVPSAPGVHLYGATSLINGCRAYDPDGTAIATVKVNYAYAGQAQGYTNAECGERTVNLNAYDNTKSANENNDFGAYPTLVRNDFSDDPGTGATGIWTVFNTTNTCGTYSFSNDVSPTSSFSGDAGVYTLRWTLVASGCYSDVLVTLTSCDVIDFDGVDDYVEFTKNSYGLGSDFGIEVWVKPDPQPANLPSTIQTIISKRNANSLIDGYDLRLTGSTLSFNWNSGSKIISPYPLTTSRWYHVAITRTGGFYRLYVDGIEVINASGSAPISNDWTCIAGAMDQSGNPPNKPVNHFSGWMDELRIWDKGLDPHHVRQMMNQQIIDNGTAVRGEIIPIDINGPDANNDGIDDIPLTWSNLLGYYRMNLIDCGYLKPFAGKGADGKLRNITSSQEETAPLPYISIRDGNWMDRNIGTSPWKYGHSVWDYPNSTGYLGAPIDWNIVQTAHNINSGNKDITVLGLISSAGKLTIADPPLAAPLEDNAGQGLWITLYLKLNGSIDLVGESQLVQKRHGVYTGDNLFTTTQFSESIFDATSLGYIERDQQGKQNSFNYNYWSSPVSAIQGIINNTPYSLSGVLRDGTDSSLPDLIEFNDGAFSADGDLTIPIKTSNRWLWAYNSATPDSNTDLQDYNQWNYLGSTGLLKTGEGFTMKGSGGTADIDALQNYVFIGKPNSGTIALPFGVTDQTYLVGNPYPSALDADEFIADNLAGRAGVNVFNGALYFWDHFGVSDNHILAEYEGGYATYTLAGGVRGINNSPLNLNDLAEGDKIPGRYIPVAQSFFVDAALDPSISGTTSTVDGGTLIFKNSQRIFIREDATNSVFMKKSGTKKMQTVAKDTRSKIRLGFYAATGMHRQLLVAADSNATNNFDIGYDAQMFDVAENDMYWKFSNSEFVIQALPNFNSDQVIPIGLAIANEGAVTIKIDSLENIPETTAIYLHDNSTATYHNIKNSDFKISLAVGEYKDRFSIHFTSKSLDLEENTLNDRLEVLYAKNYKVLVIQNKIPDVTVQDVQLFNLLGQAIESWDVEDREQTTIKIPVKNVSSGVYIVKVKTSKGQYSKKIVIN